MKTTRKEKIIYFLTMILKKYIFYLFFYIILVWHIKKIEIEIEIEIKIIWLEGEIKKMETNGY